MSRQFVTRAEHDVGPTQRARVRTLRGDRLEPREDLVAIEEPLEIRIARSGEAGPGQPVSVTMRTPGHDAELAMGFLHGEGLIRSRGDVACVREGGPDGNVVYVELSATRVPDTSSLQRNFYATSSCGVCGKASLAALAGLFDLAAVDAGLRVDASMLTSLGDVARAAQPGFRDTGGLHAATLFDADGRLIASFEDVGRHNALDKLIGSMLLDDALPLARCVLHLSGRASFELMQKAAAAGIPVVAAVGAPSSLAVELAERTGILLAGFLRGDSFNVYAHAERLR